MIMINLSNPVKLEYKWHQVRLRHQGFMANWLWIKYSRHIFVWTFDFCHFFYHIATRH